MHFSDEHLAMKLRVTENRCVVFNFSSYVCLALSAIVDCIFICNCKQYCFGLLNLISAVLMLGWRYNYVATSNDPTHVVSFKPCQSAETRELASMRNASALYLELYIHMYIYIYMVIVRQSVKLRVTPNQCLLFDITTYSFKCV